MIPQRTRLLDGDGLWSPLTDPWLPYALSFVTRI